MDAWHEIGSALAAEFSDIRDLGELTRVTLRLVVAAVLGGALGFERERQGKAAGLRTHMLVSLGSAIFVLIPLQAGVQPAELTRIIQGIVSGIGFLGAGTILKSDGDERVQGLTTAAGIWMTSAIGVTAGLGHEASAIACTVIALIVLFVIPRVVARWTK